MLTDITWSAIQLLAFTRQCVTTGVPKLWVPMHQQTGTSFPAGGFVPD